jgi:hydroxymethylbilane synthase
MSETRIRLGTRASRLALVQADRIATTLRARGSTVGIVEIVTAGDIRTGDTPWGEGAFIDALEVALRDGVVDAAVHSAKDIPIPDDADGDLVVAAYPERADDRDVLVTGAGGATLDTLPSGARVGTDSPRRTGFVLAARPDLRVVPLHGNVDTRVARLDDGVVDALVLAAAGLDRLGLGSRVDERLDPAIVPPAPGQGALAVQVRADDEATRRLVAAIDDPPTRLAVETERRILAATGGGCRSPIGAVATVDGEQLSLIAGWTALDGSRTAVVRWRGSVADAGLVAAGLAADLVRSAAARALERPRVLVTRAGHQSAELLHELAQVGVVPLSVPAIAIDPVPPDGPLDLAAARLGEYAWVVVTSPNGAAAIAAAARRVDGAARRVAGAVDGPCWAAVGMGTARALEEEGIAVRHVAEVPTAASLASTVPILPGDRVLAVRGDLVDEGLPDALRARGAIVDDVVGYRTVLAPATSRGLLRDALAADRPDAVIFTSASTVAGLLGLADGSAGTDVRGIAAICFGRGSAAAARAEGFTVIHESKPAGAREMAAATAAAVATNR